MDFQNENVNSADDTKQETFETVEITNSCITCPYLCRRLSSKQSLIDIFDPLIHKPGTIRILIEFAIKRD